MGASWRGAAALPAALLLVAKAALFAHYGMRAVSRTELLGVHSTASGVRGSSRSAEGILSWLEAGVSDVEQDLVWLGPDGGADVARAPALRGAATAVRSKHSAHREMMRDRGRQATRPHRVTSATDGLVLPIILPPALTKTPAAHDDGGEEFGQSGFTIDQLREAEKSEDENPTDTSRSDADDPAVRTGKENAAASPSDVGRAHSTPALVSSTVPYTAKALVKDDPLGSVPPAGGLIDEAQSFSGAASSSDDDTVRPPLGEGDDEGMDNDEGEQEEGDDEGMDDEDDEGEGMDGDDGGDPPMPAGMTAGQPAASLRASRPTASPVRQQLLLLSGLTELAGRRAAAGAAAPRGLPSSRLKTLQTVEGSGASRQIGPLGQSKDEVDGSGEMDAEERHEYSWDKSWWTARAWFLWAITGPTIMCLLFILSCLSQGWQCGLIYVAILLPMDIMAFYFDIFAYDSGDLFWIELTIAMLLNCVLCACLVPAYAAFRLVEEERSFRGGYGGYGAPVEGVGGSYQGGWGYGGFQPFQGQGQATGDMMILTR